MKKMVSINIGGRIISIEQNAWQVYLAYIETLYDYFVKEEGCYEIINDIENRIAELMKKKVKERRAGVNETDIKNIITIMGTAEEFKKIDAEDPDTTSDLPENAFYYKY